MSGPFHPWHTPPVFAEPHPRLATGLPGRSIRESSLIPRWSGVLTPLGAFRSLLPFALLPRTGNYRDLIQGSVPPLRMNLPH